MTDTKDIALNAKAWPFAEARKVLARIEKHGVPKKGYVAFQTGYGPSGLPHIGTFGEVARTTMVRHAFEMMSDVPTKLVSFSDDMDALRKVPGNVPNQELLQQHLGRRVTAVADPFGTHDSFGDHNNARLKDFLDGFGFDYEFRSSTACYTSGMFDETLQAVMDNYDAIMNVILPTLGEERQKTYSPFFPVDPESGIVHEVAVVERDPKAGRIVYQLENGERRESSIFGGACKLQWKVDWPMRWVALDIDYEMAGKDLSESVKLGNKIARIIGGTPPEEFSFELFLDEKGEKISKSKGNGLAMEDWLRYATPESLAYYMFQSPRKAKRLYFDVIPKAVDDYLTHVGKFAEQDPAQQLENPAFHVHSGPPPKGDHPVSFAMLLNLVSASNAHDAEVLWGFIQRYAPEANADNHPVLDEMVKRAIVYYDDFVKPTKVYRAPTDVERAAIDDLRGRLDALPGDADAETLQTEVFSVGKDHGFDNLRDWFGALYEVLLGQKQGPRMGGFIALYGKDNMVSLIDRALAGEDLKAS